MTDATSQNCTNANINTSTMKSERTMKARQVSTILAACLCGLVAFSCADANNGEFGDMDVESTEQEIGGQECKSATADYTTSGYLRWTSPKTYSNPNCSGAVVVDLTRPRGDWWDIGPAAGASTARACRDLRLHVIKYVDRGSGWQVEDEAVSTGEWKNKRCYGPWYSSNNTSAKTRFAASLKRQSLNKTRKISFNYGLIH